MYLIYTSNVNLFCFIETSCCLVKEIDRLASLLSGKEHDLQVCRQRADEAERMLTLISQWHNVIASARCQTINQAGMTTTVGTNPTHLSDETSSSSSLSLPFMQPPFFSELVSILNFINVNIELNRIFKCIYIYISFFSIFYRNIFFILSKWCNI